MRFPWIYQREASPLARILLLPLGAASRLYAAVTWLRRLAYARGWLRQTRLACKVVSVGGVMVGGSGKTPTAAWVARSLRERGHRVAIASRGYGREGRDPVVVVSDGRRVYSHAALAGDEPMLLAAHAPDVPVLVGRDRAVVGMRAVSAFGAEVLVLDDGYQHLRLTRDLDVAVFDGGLGFGNGRVLPRGPLRESARVLRCADVVGVIDGPLPDADEARLARRVPGAFRFSGRRVPSGLRRLAGGSVEPPERLSGRDVGMLTGIAQPASLRRTLGYLVKSCSVSSSRSSKSTTPLDANAR